MDIKRELLRWFARNPGKYITTRALVTEAFNDVDFKPTPEMLQPVLTGMQERFLINYHPVSFGHPECWSYRPVADRPYDEAGYLPHYTSNRWTKGQMKNSLTQLLTVETEDDTRIWWAYNVGGEIPTGVDVTMEAFFRAAIRQILLKVI